jgi:benzil reductase ((S)-benzoin forming)
MHQLTYIAGGSKGLGAQLLKVFTDQAHQVIEFSRSGNGKNHVACDFNDTEACRHIFNSTFKSMSEKQFTQINLIINTATLAPFGSIVKANCASIKQHLTINIESTLALLQTFMACYQQLPVSKGISYISSGAARRAIPGLAMYSASKAFFERLIDTIADEQANETQPFKCMIINPGVMNTDMQTEIRRQDAKDFPMVDMWNDFHKQGKLADPKDIAEVCYRLINGTGENGGYYTAQEYLSEIK